MDRLRLRYRLMALLESQLTEFRTDYQLWKAEHQLLSDLSSAADCFSSALKTQGPSDGRDGRAPAENPEYSVKVEWRSRSTQGRSKTRRTV